MTRPKRGRPLVYLEDDRKDIVEMFKQEKTIKEIIEWLGCTYPTVRKILKQENCYEKRNIRNAKRI